MIISQPAILCVQASWWHFVRRDDACEVADEAEIAGSAPTAVSIEQTNGVAVRRGPARAIDRASQGGFESVPDGPLTAAERRARAAALRALALSRTRSFGAAQAAFTEAAKLDPWLDLTRTPAFWTLERAAHEAAIEAYLAVGRDRDAVVLRARIQSTFRPKPLRARSEPLPSV